ncbi:MAG: helix-turn-helix domain-containing protein [Candidatus Tectomicrobia bacterium]|nr:helix-turn-helix domain-containing protein [Candidatus Tectomicrobia bacterium]
MGTSREVVGRLLKDFAHEGLISNARGVIHAIDIDALQKKSQK